MADEETATEEQPKGGGKKKLILFGIIGLVLLAGGIFAGPALLNMISPPSEQSAEDADGEEAKAMKPELYASLRPPLVVNFKDVFGDSHYMQITMEVMSRDQKAIDAIKEHIPVIRNGLILLYGASVYEEVVTTEGKKKMLDDGLAEIQKLMSSRTDDASIEALYFTSLIIQ